MISDAVPCKTCKQPIRFIDMKVNPKTGKRARMPVEMKAVKVVTLEGEVINAYADHWSNCDRPELHRKKG